MRGWLAVAAVVVAYDTWVAATGSPTLSAQFKVGASTHPAVMATATAYLVLHLWDQWPRALDPFCAYVALVEAAKRLSTSPMTVTSPPRALDRR